MRIQRKISQYRRDFTALYECEHCGYTFEGSGYDNAYFHQSVIPEMSCAKCGKTAVAPSSTPDVPAGVLRERDAELWDECVQDRES